MNKIYLILFFSLSCSCSRVTTTEKNLPSASDHISEQNGCKQSLALNAEGNQLRIDIVLRNDRKYELLHLGETRTFVDLDKMTNYIDSHLPEARKVFIKSEVKITDYEKKRIEQKISGRQGLSVFATRTIVSFIVPISFGSDYFDIKNQQTVIGQPQGVEYCNKTSKKQ